MYLVLNRTGLKLLGRKTCILNPFLGEKFHKYNYKKKKRKTLTFLGSFCCGFIVNGHTCRPDVTERKSHLTFKSSSSLGVSGRLSHARGAGCRSSASRRRDTAAKFPPAKDASAPSRGLGCGLARGGGGTPNKRAVALSEASVERGK